MISQVKGFSLPELAIIVAICALLAAIAVPNFYEAKTSSMIAQAKEDMRAISVGLEAYKVDLGNYPHMNNANTCLMPLERSGAGYAPTLERLTTPVSYLNGSAPFWDPFEADGVYAGSAANTLHMASTPGEVENYKQYFYTAREYDQHTQWGDLDNPTWYFLQSAAPDKKHYYMGSLMNGTSPNTSPGMKAYYSTFLYDATNGATSGGSLWRVGGIPDGYGDVLAEVVQEAESSRISEWQQIEN